MALQSGVVHLLVRFSGGHTFATSCFTDIRLQQLKTAEDLP